MRLKSYCHGLVAGRPGASNDFAQDVGMGPVYAVEVSDAEEGWPEVRGHVVEFAENVHLEVQWLVVSDPCSQ